MRPDTADLQWTTTPPAEPGHYWGYDPAGWLDIVRVDTQPCDWPGHNLKAGDLVVETDEGNHPVAGWAAYWFGPLPVPELPVIAGSKAT